MDFMPHGYCMRWEPGLLFLHVVADGLIALSYFTIPFALLYFIKRRRDLKFRGIFVLFALFILSCGITHIVSVTAIWNAHYWLEGWVKLLTGLISAYTAYCLWKAIPEALHIPSPAQLETAYQELRTEVERHKKTHLELENLNRELEERVRKRTEELETTLNEVKRLQSGMTTVCAWTRRIKDHGKWISFEEFMEKHLGMHITHGISEEALNELKRDLPAIAEDIHNITKTLPDLKSPPPEKEG